MNMVTQEFNSPIPSRPSASTPTTNNSSRSPSTPNLPRSRESPRPERKFVSLAQRLLRNRQTIKGRQSIKNLERIRERQKIKDRRSQILEAQVPQELGEKSTSSLEQDIQRRNSQQSKARVLQQPKKRKSIVSLQQYNQRRNSQQPEAQEPQQPQKRKSIISLEQYSQRRNPQPPKPLVSTNPTASSSPGDAYLHDRQRTALQQTSDQTSHNNAPQAGSSAQSALIPSTVGAQSSVDRHNEIPENSGASHIQPAGPNSTHQRHLPLPNETLLDTATNDLKATKLGKHH